MDVKKGEANGREVLVFCVDLHEWASAPSSGRCPSAAGDSILERMQNLSSTAAAARWMMCRATRFGLIFVGRKAEWIIRPRSFETVQNLTKDFKTKFDECKLHVDKSERSDLLSLFDLLAEAHNPSAEHTKAALIWCRDLSADSFFGGADRDSAARALRLLESPSFGIDAVYFHGDSKGTSQRTLDALTGLDSCHKDGSVVSIQHTKSTPSCMGSVASAAGLLAHSALLRDLKRQENRGGSSLLLKSEKQRASRSTERISDSRQGHVAPLFPTRKRVVSMGKDVIRHVKRHKTSVRDRATDSSTSSKVNAQDPLNTEKDHFAFTDTDDDDKS